MSKYETVIGLEVHVELSTKSKIFCGCSTEFGAPPNTNTCPVCLGHPGVLPVLNKQAVNFAMKAAMALNCEIAEYSKFDRKNYFYPDSPKAYQISQYDQPIGQNGWIEIEVDGRKKRIGITRLHLEEDAGKLNHSENGDGSLVDFNRVGVPLIEIVSEPDLRSPAEARAYLEKLKTIIQYTGVSDVRMEEGSLRCDANISLRPVGQERIRHQDGNEKLKLVQKRGKSAGIRTKTATGNFGPRRKSGATNLALAGTGKPDENHAQQKRKRTITVTSPNRIWSRFILTKLGKKKSAQASLNCRISEKNGTKKSSGSVIMMRAF